MFGKSRWTLQVAGRQNFTCRFIIVTDMRATVIFLSSSRQEDKKPFSSLQVNQNYFRLQQRHVSSGTNEPVIACQMFDSWAASLILWDLSKYYYQYYSVIIVVPLFDSAEGFQEYDVQQKVSFLELKHWSCSYQPEHLLGKCLTNFYGNWVVNIIKSRDESGSSDEHDDDAQIYIRSYSLQMGPCQEQMYISANHGFAKTYKYISWVFKCLLWRSLLIVWLSLGTKHILWLEIPSFVATNMNGKCPDALSKISSGFTITPSHSWH